MVYLGISVHLLEDTSMPAHSRPKFHLPRLFQDSLEKFMNKNLELMKLYLGNVKVVIKGSFDEYFEDMATVSRQFKQGKTSLFSFIKQIFTPRKITKEDLIKQTKELGPMAISYTMGLLNEFYKKIN